MAEPSRLRMHRELQDVVSIACYADALPARFPVLAGYTDGDPVLPWFCALPPGKKKAVVHTPETRYSTDSESDDVAQL
jgi:hypothetical protein